MAAVATLQEYSAHHYLLAALAVVFFLVIMPWLGWAWMNPEERRRLCRLLGGQDGLLVNAIIPAVVVQFGLRIRPVKREIHRYA